MKTVLVLEDDPSNMQAFSALLWSMGYRVLEATTGKEAIEAGRPHYGPIDLFLSDVDVPELSGTAVAVELIKSHPPSWSCLCQALRCMHGAGLIWPTSGTAI